MLSEERCFILNFGHESNVPFPQIKVSPDHDLLTISGLVSRYPNKCSIAIVGHKYLDQVDHIMMVVDKITDDIEWMPYAVFLMAEKPGQDIQFNVSTRDNMSPAMVRPVLKPETVIR